MPKTALADMLLEWDSLFTGVDRPDILSLPYMRELRDDLATHIDLTKGLVREQESLEGRRRAVTQQLRIARSEGQDLVVRVRAALRSHLGHRNEGLVRYRIRPIRRRSRAIREEVGIAPLPTPPSATLPQPVPAPEVVIPEED
ncbi:MAG TPA: hypothetical protein VNW71_03350 [Thermoanaerobaculia bacterium]|nr:hypothetical protein [Thermoanaerobaculia bacterium]